MLLGSWEENTDLKEAGHPIVASLQKLAIVFTSMESEQ